VGERELEVLGDELADVGALDVLGLLELDDAEDLQSPLAKLTSECAREAREHGCRQTYVDGPEAGTVAGGHVGVQGLDGVRAAHLAVLAVHVVGAGARVVADPDAKVLDLLGVLLVQRLDADNLTSGLLDLLETADKVPEAGLGDRGVGGEDGHAVQRGLGVGLGGQVAPDNLILLKATCEEEQSAAVADNACMLEALGGFRSRANAGQASVGRWKSSSESASWALGCCETS